MYVLTIHPPPPPTPPPPPPSAILSEKAQEVYYTVNIYKSPSGAWPEGIFYETINLLFVSSRRFLLKTEYSLAWGVETIVTIVKPMKHQLLTIDSSVPILANYYWADNIWARGCWAYCSDPLQNLNYRPSPTAGLDLLFIVSSGEWPVTNILG